MKESLRIESPAWTVVISACICARSAACRSSTGVVAAVFGGAVGATFVVSEVSIATGACFAARVASHSLLVAADILVSTQSSRGFLHATQTGLVAL